MSTHNIGQNRLIETILMSTHNLDFYEEISKIILQLSSNIIKYIHTCTYYLQLLKQHVG